VVRCRSAQSFKRLFRVAASGLDSMEEHPHLVEVVILPGEKFLDDPLQLRQVDLLGN